MSMVPVGGADDGGVGDGGVGDGGAGVGAGSVGAGGVGVGTGALQSESLLHDWLQLLLLHSLESPPPG